MKIGLVSTYPPRQCGIATYTHKLASALAAGDLGVAPAILAERGGAEIDPAIPCAACFSRRDDYAAAIAETAGGCGLALAHFEHAPDIFGLDGRMVRAAELLRARGVRVVVTLHTVFTRRSGLVERKPFAARFHRRLGRAVDAIVVHTETSADILQAHGVPAARIAQIPHGTDDPLRGDPLAGRRILGVGPRARVLLFFGFVHVQKNIHVLLAALERVVSRAPDATLAIVGKPGGDAWYNRLYARYLARRARRAGLERNVAIVDRFVSDAEAVDIHAAALMVLLPHAQGYGSASGVVHNAMALGLPVVCSDSLKFEEVARNISPELLVPAHAPRAWAEKICALLEDEELRAAYTAQVEAYARRTRWSEVARQHTELYRRVVGDGRVAGAVR
jgi:glycosyltransferase involved in cell wall biosynthesis